MARLKCNSCEGEYDDTQGGSPYYHACPPEIFIARHTEDAQGKVTQAEIRAPRPNPRNENPVADASGKLTQIKQAGLGITRI